MMDENERRDAELLRDRLRKILPELKLAYEYTKKLFGQYNWDISYWYMSEAYMNLAADYINVMEALEEDYRGGEK